MQAIHQQTRGVLHLKQSEQHYELRRYKPSVALEHYVEAFWIVNWKLAHGEEHIQQNIPHPNCNLTIENKQCLIYGPVSKSFSYPLMASGEIIGVKFTPAGFYSFYQQPLAQLVDKVIPAEQLLPGCESLLKQLQPEQQDHAAIIRILEQFLLQQCKGLEKKQVLLNQWLMQISQQTTLTTVEQLETEFSQNKRQLQRLFRQYIGLSPKWVLRKYRLHQLLDKLENQQPDMQQLLCDLSYSDQSHFIRDFKAFTGTSPAKYTQQHKS